jgi:hypothetical protein
MDVHLHTPASVDYRQANVSYLDILKKAEERGLDIISFTDHNTAAGYQRYLKEVESLALLEQLNRLTDEERGKLAEYRRLQDKLLILPGFEITATLGFHILGLFPPETTVRELEYLLLSMRVPADKLDLGSGEVGATSDVLSVYRLIDEAGGLVIAAHANSSHGVAMPGFDFGGQTRISYTQDPHLHALEVTDLMAKTRRRTALFFSGTKPEYPRRMHLIQSSDSHRLIGIPHNNQELGVGDRATEILLDELSFEAIKDVFLGNDFARVRPFVPSEATAFDPISQAREEGDTLVQAFHEHLQRGRGIEHKIMQDVVALANTNGGTIYIGLSGSPRQPVLGVQRPGEAIHQLRAEMAKCVVPPLEVQLDAQKVGNKSVIRIIVPRGSEVPYAYEGTHIYVRSENETSLAVRDEIVNLVRDSVVLEFAATPVSEPTAPPEEPVVPAESPEPELAVAAPRTGVEVMPTERRKGEQQYTVRDLRNNRLIHNVTRSSARKLWQYAISEHEERPVNPGQVKWQGNIGVWKAHRRAGKLRYDLCERDSAEGLHTYYGVTEDGIHGAWKELIETEAETPEVDETERAESEFAEAEESERTTAEMLESRSEEYEPERVESLPPEGTQVTQWPPQEMIASSEQNEPVPSEMDYSSGEMRPITDMGFQVESIPDEAVQPGPDKSSFSEQTFTAHPTASEEDHAPESYMSEPEAPSEPPAQAEDNAQPEWYEPEAPTELAEMPQPDLGTLEQFNPPSPAEAVPGNAEVKEGETPDLDRTPGVSTFPPLQEQEQPPFDISPDTDTMGTPPGESKGEEAPPAEQS